MPYPESQTAEEEETTEEQETKAETSPPSSTSKAAKFTWQFRAWVRVLVAHLIACQRVRNHIKTRSTESCFTFHLLDVPYEKMSTGPSMEQVLTDISIGELAITELKTEVSGNKPKTQPKDSEGTTTLFQFHGVIHSEMALVMSLVNYLNSQPNFPKRQLTIGTSKPCCPVCYTFLHTIQTRYEIPICIGGYHLTPSPVSLPPNVTSVVGSRNLQNLTQTVCDIAQGLHPEDSVKTHQHTKTDTSVISDHPELEKSLRTNIPDLDVQEIFFPTPS